MRRIVIGLVLLLVVCSGAALGFAPYLPRLIFEGGPALTWQGVGEFAEIRGASMPRDLGPRVEQPLDARSQELFSASGGAAKFAFCSLQSSCRRVRMAELAATPPAIARVGRSGQVAR